MSPFWIINSGRIGMLLVVIAAWLLIYEDVHKAIEGGLWFVIGIIAAMLLQEGFQWWRKE